MGCKRTNLRFDSLDVASCLDRTAEGPVKCDTEVGAQKVSMRSDLSPKVAEATQQTQAGVEGWLKTREHTVYRKDACGV